VKGEPFRDFSGFATTAAGPDLPLRASPGLGPQDVLATGGTELDQAFAFWRSPLETCAEIFRRIAEGEATTFGQVLAGFPPEQRALLELAVMWLIKHGFVDWPT
jgi:hypothetical protein